MSKTVKIILIVVLCLAIVGAVAGVIAWTQSDKFDQKDLSYVGKYEVGGLDSAGNYMSTNASIYTKKPIECQGLNCNLVFDNTISYQLYFYDQNNDFVHTTGRLTGTFVEESVPFFAKYVRIVITPNDDNKVTSLEVGKYAKQLNVSVNREQGFKNYTENLVEIEIEHAEFNTTDGSADTSKTDSTTGLSSYISIVPYKEALLFRVAPGTDLSKTALAFFDASKGLIKVSGIANFTSYMFTSSEGTNYYNIIFDNLNFGDKVPAYIRICCGMDHPVEIYCR